MNVRFYQEGQRQRKRGISAVRETAVRSDGGSNNIVKCGKRDKKEDEKEDEKRGGKTKKTK